MNKLTQLAVDVFRGSTGEFSLADSEATLRATLKELNGGSENFNYKTMRKAATREAVFEAMEEILEVLLLEGLENQFADFVDVRNVAFGDKNFFMLDDYHLFRIASVSGGNGSIRRQRLDRTGFSVSTAWKSVKLYEELEKFMAGRSSWAYSISKIQRSLEAQIVADIYVAFQNAYNSLTAPYIYNGTFDRTQLNTIVQHIEAATGRECFVYGTKLGLQQATPAYVSYNMMDERNNTGYFRVIDGIKMVELKQSHVPGTDTFAISDKALIIVPQGEEKIVKLVFEGQAIVEETSQGTLNADRTFEYGVSKKYGVGVVTATRYGAMIMP